LILAKVKSILHFSRAPDEPDRAFARRGRPAMQVEKRALIKHPINPIDPVIPNEP
jgi:hypothetical protein